MKIKGIEFHPVLAQSGLMNFTGKGYWYSKLAAPFLRGAYNKVTFVSKTTTLEEREGNMPLKSDEETPREWLPKCIWVDLVQGITLNAVGLSGPGLIALLRKNVWQQWKRPFWISVMSVAPTKAQRIAEYREIAEILFAAKKTFAVPFGLQVNASCPNQKGVSPSEALEETEEVLDLFSMLRVPIMVKLSVTTRPEQAKRIADHDCCDALCVSNTVAFGKLPELIDWYTLFKIPRDEAVKPELSPLFSRIGMVGGLSGPPLFPLVLDWVCKAREAGITCHMNAGGGIFHREDVRALKAAGADSISLGTVCMHRPWRVPGIVREAEKHFA